MSKSYLHKAARTLIQSKTNHNIAEQIFCDLRIGNSQPFFTALKEIQAKPQHKSLLKLHLPSILKTALPDSALLQLQRSLNEEATAKDILEDSRLASRFIALAGHAPFLGKLLLSKSYLRQRLFSTTEVTKGLDGCRDPQMLTFTDRDSFKAALRQLKYSRLLDITENIIHYPSEVLEALSALTALANHVLAEALRGASAEMLQAKFANPTCQTLKGNTIEVPLAVVNLGKLGGDELNYSSDVDLLFVYLTDRGGSGQLSSQEYFNRLTSRFVDILSARDAEGFCYRVDLRLRPLGSSGRAALSLAAMENYYQLSGMAWERLILLKAASVVGDARLGQAFLDMVQPFVYRRSIDYSMIEAIKLLKDEIDTTGRSLTEDIKVGPGGIREIEFFTQTLQIIYGGRDKRIRQKSTIPALNLLYQGGYISEKDYSCLKESYLLFRQIENVLQMREERQTHKLPKFVDEKEWRAIAASVLPDEVEKDTNFDKQFMRQVEKSREAVREIFLNLFHKKDSVQGFIATAPEAVLEGVSGPLQEAMSRLAKALDPALAEGANPFRGLVKEVVTLAEATPDPTMALDFFADFISKFQNRTSVMQQLMTKPMTLKYLTGLFGTSRDLSRFFVRHPELLDRLLLYGDVVFADKRERLQDSALTLVLGKEHFEDQLESLRIFKNGEVVRIALNDLYGFYDLRRVLQQLSNLADACIQTAITMSFREIGVREVPRYLIIGLGKLGGQELGYGSDLDLLFLVTEPNEVFQLDSGKRMSGFELMVKIAQKVISVLQLPTTTGRLYRLDMRLRPSGNQGTLVTSLQAFRDYHLSNAGLWERQALLKARRVAGDPQLWKQVRDIVASVSFHQLTKASIKADIMSMRQRLEKELAHDAMGQYNIKTGWGGLLDIEFAVQFMQLTYGKKSPALLQANTPAALKLLHDHQLVETEAITCFKEAYDFYRLLENRLYLLTNRSESSLNEKRDQLDRLAKSLKLTDRSEGHLDGGQLLKYYQQMTSRVRAYFNKIMSSVDQ